MSTPIKVPLRQMTDPVLIDDGGSVRIRRAGGGKMDDLLAGIVSFPTESANNLRVVSIDSTGTATTVNQALNPGDTVTVFVGIAKVAVTFSNGDGAGTPSTLSVDLGFRPFIEAKSLAGTRRYCIAHVFPKVTKVTFNSTSVFTDNNHQYVYARLT
jgi:hypothetical protein